MKYNKLILLGFFVAITSGCLTTKSQKEETANKQQPEVINEDIEVIARNDTSGRVDAAREAAKKLLSDAKAEAARIKKEAEDIMEVKSKEAEKKAEEIIASMTEDIKKNKASVAKEYLLEMKSEAENKAKEMLVSAKDKASEIKTSALKYAEKVKDKGKSQSEKIASRIIENARKSAADITAKADNKASEIKKESAKLFEAAKTYTEKKKKEADEYLKKKMDEADKLAANMKGKLKKDLEDDAKPALANSILEKILKGMEDNDYKNFTSHFTPDMKSNFTKKRFEALNSQLKEKIGEYKKRTYLGTLQKGPLTVYLWKGEFSGAKNNDLVIRLTLGELDGKEQVFAFDISNL